MDTEQIKQMAIDVNNVAEASFQSGAKHAKRPLLLRIEQLEKAMRSVAEKLRKKRIHPLDIIPIERPHRLAEELESALEESQ